MADKNPTTSEITTNKDGINNEGTTINNSETLSSLEDVEDDDLFPVDVHDVYSNSNKMKMIM